MKGDALIRANFHLEPETLQLSRWNTLYAQAIWLERWRLENQAELLQAMMPKI